MKPLLILFSVCVLLLNLTQVDALGQTIRLDSLTNLSSDLTESSGLIYHNGKLITHNDSGGEAALYEVDTLMGNVLRTVHIGNANNIDWEDICLDANYIYIGDFGNNFGTRQDLQVYKIPVSDFEQKDTVLAERIRFSYADQTTFTPNQFQTNFDAEALISYGDSLYIFSKNWGDSRTNIYPLSKDPGTYVISKRDSIDSQGLITGASFDQESGELWMCGYTFSEAFILQVKEVTSAAFSSGEITRYPLDINGSFQVEAIAGNSSGEYFISAEGNANIPGNLYRLSLNEPNSRIPFENLGIEMYPIPASNKLLLKSSFTLETSIYTFEGKQILHTHSNEIDLSELSTGHYMIHIFVREKHQIYARRFLIDR